MTEPIMSFSNVEKIYNKKTVLNIKKMDLYPGKIYALIGPNGAGKTTLMRIMTGLAAPTKGTYEKKDIQIGCIIEAPAVNPTMTAYENLEMLCKLCNMDNVSERIQAALGQVYLTNTGSKTAGQFSLGMKQRLAIAMALLSNPSCLVLDEPINGLDPSGIAEMRTIFRELSDKGITIIISSHILKELSGIATDYILIKEGKIIWQGENNESQILRKSDFVIETSMVEKAANLLKVSYPEKSFSVTEDNKIIISEVDNSAELIKYLVNNQVDLRQAYYNSDSAEYLYNSFFEEVGEGNAN